MEAKDLRVGNTINHEKHGDIVVLGITPHCGDYRIESEIGWVYLKNCAGIPLTEEWLLRFGFRENENHEHPSFNEFIIPEDSDFGIGDFNGEYWIIEFLDQTYGSPEIKYVHTLQNLYFALTGEELTIKSNG